MAFELETPDGWRLVKLSDLGEVNRGRSRHRPRHAQHLYGGPYPFIQTGGIKASGGRITTYQQTYSEAGLAQSRLWPAETMCITIAANIAETAILTYPACFPDSVIGFIADKTKCDVRFVEYMFRYLKRHIQFIASDSGTVQDNINLGFLEAMRFPIPDTLEEQQAIVHILGTLDDKIELNRRMNQTLEGLARAVFRSWFVDFDPVVAKAAGRRPLGMDAATARLFPDSFADSPLGPIPKGWRIGKLGEIATINARSIRKDYPHSVIEYIDISSVTVGHLERTTRYEMKNAPSRAQRLVSHGDTLWSCVRPNRKSYLFLHQPEPNVIASTGFAVLTSTAAAPCSLHLTVMTDEFVDYLESHAEGSAYPAVRPDSFSKADVLIPTREVLPAFERQVSPLFDRWASNEKQSRTLADLRDALLPQLLSGELWVKQAERAVEEVV